MFLLRNIDLPMYDVNNLWNVNILFNWINPNNRVTKVNKVAEIVYIAVRRA